MNETPLERTGDWQMSAEGKARVWLEEMLDRQELNWLHGKRVLVEELIAEVPDGNVSAPDLLELIVNEVVLREEQGDKATLSDYQKRFPDLADALRIQWEVDRALFSRLSSRHSARKRPADASGNETQVGRYEIRGVLGKGGMGVAYKAWDPNLRREVALKTLRAGTQADDDQRDRFRLEAEAIARVRHPYIVQVFDVGESAGQLYFTMEYCTGGSLAGRLKGNPLPSKDAATMVRSIARGVAAAHANKIIHRDLKPANVLLSPDDSGLPGMNARPGGKSTVINAGAGTNPSSAATETTPTGVAPVKDTLTGFIPKVTDFGLAKKLDDEADLTHSGAIMGSPSYMAPEQAFGDSKRVGPAVDIYACGAILYECLTGNVPFKGVTIGDTLDQVRHKEPVPVRQVQPRTPRDLETISLKCLQKDPAKRYATAEALADDLQRYLDGHPILARPVGPLARAWRWCQRNPFVASLLLLTFVVLLAGTVSTTLMWLRAERNFVTAEENYEEALNAVNESFTLISEDELLSRPGMVGLRYKLLSATEPFLERFVEKRKDDPKARRELALARIRLAVLASHNKTPEEATRRYDETINLLDGWLKENPNDTGLIKAAAEARVKQSSMLGRMRQEETADKRLSEAMAMLEQLRTREPTEWSHAVALADCRVRLAAMREERQGPQNILPLYQAAFDDFRNVYENPPATVTGPWPPPAMKTQYSRMRQAFGQFLMMHDGRLELALSELEAAKTLLTELLGIPSQQFYARIELVTVNALLGQLHAKLDSETPGAKHREQARECLKQATREAEKLAAEHPTDVQFRMNFGTHFLKSSSLFSGWDDQAEAKSYAEKAANHFRHLRQEQPGIKNFRRLLALALERLSEICDEQSEQPNAMKTALLEESIRHLSEAIETITPPKQFGLPASALAEFLIHRGRILQELNQHARAIADFDAIMQMAPPGSPPWKDAEQEKAKSVRAMKK